MQHDVRLIVRLRLPCRKDELKEVLELVRSCDRAFAQARSRLLLVRIRFQYIAGLRLDCDNGT